MKSVVIRGLFGLVLFASFSIVAGGQTQPRDDLLKEIETKHAELQQLEKLLLAPSQDDRIAVADFLAEPDTGLTRLLPREIYDSSNHPEKRMTIHGGGSYFSFTRLTHEYGWGTQIGLEQGDLLTCFAGADYGMLADLGDVPLDSVNLQNATVNFVAAYEPATAEPNARTEYRRFGAGVNNGGTVYKTRLPAVVNHSYILRGIHYSDSDILVSFRVLRKDIDGSVIILWKILKKYPKPELARIQPGN